MSTMEAAVWDTTQAERIEDDTRPAITSPEAAHRELRHLEDAPVEEAWLLVLDTRHRLVAKVMISRGSIDHTFMSPREIIREALLYNGAAIVVAHNHPSGDPSFSADDEAVTRRIAAAGELMGIQVLDSLVVARRGFVSGARRGLV